MTSAKRPLGLFLAVLSLLLVCESANAATSLNLIPGRTGTYTVPNSGPYQAMQAFRIEFRMHDFEPCNGNVSNIWDLGPISIRCFLDGTTDIIISDGPASRGIIIPLAGRTDFVMRVQRNGDVLRGEIWNADNTNYKFYSTDGVTGTPQNVSGPKQVGGSTTVIKIAWFRWYASTLPTGSRLPLNYLNGDTPTLGYWNLENGLSDTSGNGMNISMSGANFAATPAYDPVATLAFMSATGSSGPEVNVARAGHLTRISAADSYSFADSIDLKFQWAQLDGPVTLNFEEKKSGEVSFDNASFGEYKVQLTVEDADGRTTRREFVFGAVATDDEGRVQPEDPMVTKVFGPMLRWGLSPWPYLDDRHAVFANHFGQSLTANPKFRDDWNEPLSGTVSVTNGSNTVTGTGTNFQVDFCGSEGATTPDQTRVFVLWYPAGGGRFGRRTFSVTSCDSPTQMKFDSIYLTTGNLSGLQYARMGCLGCWIGGSDNFNYYDNVMAHYAMYYRTALTKYRDYARLLADRWWSSPATDQGRACTFGGDAGRSCTAPRVQAYVGLLWRAHDGRPDMWPDLRIGINHFKTGQSRLVFDVREQGYSLSFVAVAAMLDPDQIKRNEYLADVNASVNDLWKASQDSSGVWLNYSYGYEANNTNPPNSINVTRGSNEILGNNTANYWPVNSAGLWILRQGDRRPYYTQPGSNNTRLILDRPYEGESANGQLYQMNVFVGYGVAPFTLGILGNGMYYAYLATGNESARQIVLDVAHWLKRYGVRVATRGLYYGRLYPPCEPDPDTAPNCIFGSASDPLIVAAERYLSGEVIKTFTEAYLLSGDPDLKATADDLVGAALGKTGGPLTDNNFVLELDQTLQFDKAKNFGFWFGFGASHTWPAGRLGAPPVVGEREQVLSLPAAPLPGASATRVERRVANGGITAIDCDGTSPCRFVLNPQHRTANQILEHKGAGSERKGRSAEQPVKQP